MTILNLEIYNIGQDLSAIFGLEESILPEKLQLTCNLIGYESTHFIENEGNFIGWMII